MRYIYIPLVWRQVINEEKAQVQKQKGGIQDKFSLFIAICF